MAALSRGLWGYVVALRSIVLSAAIAALCVTSAAAQNAVPAPSQVAPPVIAPRAGGARIVLPQVPAGATLPEAAKKLNFFLVDFIIEGEFDEFIEARRAIAEPLLGKRITVADVFEFVNKLQQIYSRAGYPLVRVVISPQQLENRARVKLQVIDGFIERFDLEAMPTHLRDRTYQVIAPLRYYRHLTQAELERKLLIAGDAAGLELNAVFAGGKEIGGSVLVLTGRYRPMSLSVYGDNSLPEVFGTGQIVTSASLNSLMGNGEQLTVTASGLPDKDWITPFATRRYLSASFMTPIGYDGLKLEFGGTDGRTTPRVPQNVASQGLIQQTFVKLSYDAIKTRNFELTFAARFDATNEEIDTLLFTPAIPLSLDRLRVFRGNMEGIWRIRETGTTISFGGTYSHGIDGLGARTLAVADPLLPLSRQKADAGFNKLDGHLEVAQSLPYDFLATFAAFGQTSFNEALLTSEQFGIVGAKMLSGYTSGALSGDLGWVMRGEIARPFTLPIENGSATFSPYGFYATGERLYEAPTALEIESIHAINYGGGVRFSLAPWADYIPNTYAFVEYSRRHTTDPNLDGWRIFTGGVMRY